MKFDSQHTRKIANQFLVLAYRPGARLRAASESTMPHQSNHHQTMPHAEF